MNTLSRLAALVAAICLIGSAWAQQPDPRAEDRKQLRAMLAEFEAAINAQSIERMIAEMDDSVTVIWLNAEVSRGKDQVRAYYGRMVGHDKAILNKYLTKATIGAPARFYGDVAIADGSTADEFYPIARGVFRLDSRWSTTVAKNPAGEWKIVLLHLSSNVFNNPLLDEVKADIVKGAVGGLIAGLMLMYVVMRLRRR
ncbi:MAG TPA: nuclear transport factor 2 family protein [Casimicrobiaceae bacterium]|nr:nuclear transport factor 2 family protein [Casimicrobiaceae bacterium]